MLENQALKMLCPLDAVKGEGDVRCAGSDCMAWRWLPFVCDDEWRAAVKQAAEELGDTSPNRMRAAKAVGEDRAKYGLPTEPTHGYCGLGGKPEI